MHLSPEAITVELNSDGEPFRFVWRGKEFQIQAIKDQWLACNRWWAGDRPQKFYRVQACQLAIHLYLGEPHIYEIYYSQMQWMLSKVAD